MLVETGPAAVQGRAAGGTPYAWFVVLVLMSVYTCGYIDRYALTIVLDEVKAEFGASDTYMGFLAGPAFAFFFTAASLPIARLADRYSRVAILAVGCATWSGFTLLSAMAETKLGFTVGRLGVGLGEATCLAPIISLIADYFPPRSRALPLAFFNLSVYLGKIGGLWIGGSLSAEHGWRQTYIFIGAPGLVIAVLLWLLVREPRRGGLDGKSESALLKPPSTFWATAQMLFRIPVFRGMVAGSALATFSGMGFAYWAPALFLRVHHMLQSEVGRDYGLTFGLSSMLGALLAGKLANVLARKNGNRPLLISAGCVLVAMIFMAATSLAPSARWALIFVAVGGVANGGWLIPVQAALQDLVPASVRATAAAIFVSLSMIIGFSGPLAVGVLSDAFAPIWGEESLRYAIAAVVFVSIASAAVFLRAANQWREVEPVRV